jgi:hypothetical protein
MPATGLGMVIPRGAAVTVALGVGLAVASELRTGADGADGTAVGLTSRSAAAPEADVGVGVCCGANMGGKVPTLGGGAC